MNKPFVAILMGSDADYSVMETTVESLKQLQIPFEVKVTSAHRTPEATRDYVKESESRGCLVFIAAAGLAAHLAGAVAAVTVRPVIGVPVDAGPLQGFDALLSTVQMPGGIPVACVAIGKAGAKNAAYLAAEILALNDQALFERLKQDRESNAKKLQQRDAALKSQWSQD